MTTRRHTLLCCVAMALAVPTASYAVCFAPGTQRSGYTLPLRDEVTSADWIVVGRIVSQSARPDPAAPRDPDAIGNYVFRVEVLRTLKGAPPRSIEIESPADSSGYRVGVGETHLLFIHSMPQSQVDACGNSGVLEKSSDTLYATERLLAKLTKPAQPAAKSR